MNKPFYMYMSVQGMGRNVLVCLITMLLFVSCQSYKKVPYLQDAEIVQQTVQHENLYDAKIMPKDLLTIVVSCTSPELAVPFNLTVARDRKSTRLNSSHRSLSRMPSSA